MLILPRAYVAICALMFECGGLGASTIISIDGSNDVAYVLGTPTDQVLVESWNSTASYNSADISFITVTSFLLRTKASRGLRT
jgi:hypothetical protein